MRIARTAFVLVAFIVLSVVLSAKGAENVAPVDLKSSGIYAIVGDTPVSIASTEVQEESRLGPRAMMKVSWKGQSEMKSKLAGARAETRVSQRFEFYIKGFDPKGYTLIRLDQKGNEREFVSSKASGGMRSKGGLRSRMMGGLKVTGGLSEEAMVQVTVEELDGSLYKVLPAEPLEKGEYAFVNGRLLHPFGVD